MPQNAFFPQTHDLLVSQKMTQRHFFSALHPLSPVIFATATVMAFVLLCNSRFNFHCYTQCEATPTHRSARKWRCDCACAIALTNFCAKDYKGHSLVQTSFTEPPNSKIIKIAKTHLRKCFFIRTEKVSSWHVYQLCQVAEFTRQPSFSV